jgi:hypothetical protein
VDVPTKFSWPARTAALILLAALALLAPAVARADAAKPRMILTQDGEVDDMDSFIRFLYYSNEFDTAGIIYTSSTFHYAGNGTTVQPFRWTGTEWLNHYLDLYAQIRPNLVKHADGYPTVDELRSVYKIGNISNVGEMTQVTEGSEWIKAKILDDDSRTLYIQAWGGTNTTARALKSIQEQYQNTPEWPAIVDKINRKVVIYNILTQDTTLNSYIRPNWPGVKIIDNQSAFWAFAYQWTSRTPAPNQFVLRSPWMEQNMLIDKGPLMEEYRTYRDGKPTPGDDQNNRWRPEMSSANQNNGYAIHDFISEGDSPAYMFLFDFNGLRSSENPTWGGWGGRFAPNATGWVDTPDENPYSTNTNNRRSYPLTRWFVDLQNDFASRVAWGTASTYAAANHPPAVKAANLDVRVAAGERVALTGTATDPDGNAVTWNWWEYTDADTYAGKITIDNAATPDASFVVPADAKPGDTIHVIMDVKDQGTPSISRYQRVVVTVVAKTDVTMPVGGSVPATLALSLGAPASFGAFTPGLAKDYTASTTATVISSAGDAALTVADAGSVATGHLVNGAFSLPKALQASAGAAFADVGSSAAPTLLKAWSAPTSNEAVPVTFKQSIAATDALRTGAYAKTLTFTLSTTTP